MGTLIRDIHCPHYPSNFFTGAEEEGQAEVPRASVGKTFKKEQVEEQRGDVCRCFPHRLKQGRFCEQTGEGGGSSTRPRGYAPEGTG